MNTSNRSTVRVAAIQLEGRIGDIEHNLNQVEMLLGKALDWRPNIIALPEFFTTPIAYDPILFKCSLPPDNPALDLLKTISRRHNVLIGGSYLEYREGDVFNTYVVVEPQGTVHRHDKDLPTMVENAFYRGGADDGRFNTSLGSIGAAVCWELVRTQTVGRLRGKVDLLMTGSHWWSPPQGWPVLRRFWKTMEHQNDRHMTETPSRFARLVGAPLVHAGQVGELDRPISLLPGGWPRVPFRSKLMGESQIVDRDGTVLARRTRLEGPGVITAELTLGATDRLEPLPERFWLPDFSKRFQLFWAHQNWVNRPAYRRAKAQGQIEYAEISPRPRSDNLAREEL